MSITPRRKPSRTLFDIKHSNIFLNLSPKAKKKQKQK